MKTTFSINKIGKTGRVIANGDCDPIRSDAEAFKHAVKFVPDAESVIRQSAHDYHKHGKPFAEMNVYGSNMSTYLLLSK